MHICNAMPCVYIAERPPLDREAGTATVFSLGRRSSAALLSLSTIGASVDEMQLRCALTRLV